MTNHLFLFSYLIEFNTATMLHLDRKVVFFNKIASLRYSLLLVALILSVNMLSAQTVCNLHITGKIIDDHDKTPLSEATILLVGNDKGTISDSMGNYSLSNLCPGTYTITVQHIGCTEQEKKVTLQVDTRLDFILEHHEEELQEIIIKSKQLLYETPTQASSQIKGNEYRARADENIGTLLNKITGVTTLQTGPGIAKPVIQGITGSRIILLNNGIKLESQQWGPEHAPEIDPFASSSATVIKGAGAVRYGTDALGGVILVEPSILPAKEGVSGESYAVFRSNGLQWIQSHKLEGGLNREGWGWRVQGSYKRGGDQQAPRYYLTNTALQEGGASTAFGYRKFRFGADIDYNFYHSDMGILRSAHIGNLSDLQLAIERDTPLIVEPFSYNINNPRQAVDHHLLKMRGFYRIQERLKLSMQYAMQNNHREEYDLRRGGRSDIAALNLQLTTHFFEAVLDHQEYRNWTGSSGVSVQHQYNYNVPGTGVRPLIPDFASQTMSIFHLEKYATDNWEVEAGGRYEFNHLLVKRIDGNNQLQKPEFNFHNFAISAGAIYHPNDFIHAKINIGGYSRSPQVNELYSGGLHHSAAAIEYGNESLQPERGLKAILTLEGVVKEYFDWNITPHFAQVKNYIFLVADSVPELTIRGAFPVFRYIQTEATIGGIDVEVHGHPHPLLTVGVKGSFVRGRDKKNDQWLIYMPSDRITPELAYKQIFKEKHTLILDTQLPYVFEQKKYEPTLDVSAPPGAYLLWNLHAGYAVQLKKVTLQSNMEVENVLNTTYRDYMDRLRYYADNRGRSFNIKMYLSY